MKNNHLNYVLSVSLVLLFSGCPASQTNQAVHIPLASANSNPGQIHNNTTVIQQNDNNENTQQNPQTDPTVTPPDITVTPSPVPTPPPSPVASIAPSQTPTPSITPTLQVSATPIRPEPEQNISSEEPETIASPVEISTPEPTPTPIPTPLPISTLGMTFANIPAGSFVMGSPAGVGNSNERPQHQVTLASFQMQTTEVTQKQWLEVMGSWPGTTPQTPNEELGLGDQYPMYFVSWYDAQAFIQQLNQNYQGTYRLPTEAEWEYAARAGNTTSYACGEYVTGSVDCPDSMAWFSENNGASGTPQYGSKPVGIKQPNAWGLYDMHGNVWEWVQDWYDASYYSSSLGNNPTGPATGSHRMLRGGSWHDEMTNVRSSLRFHAMPMARNGSGGFRVVRLP